MSKAIEVSSLHKSFYTNGKKLEILHGLTFSVEKGEMISLTGPSGSGKSTLMAILGCLDKPTSGTYKIDGQEVSKLTAAQQATLRNQKIGFVFQKFHLLPGSTALENVALPKLYAGMPEKEANTQAEQLLTMMDLKKRSQHYPSQLSGGQQQRVAIARALANNPSIILADEPTGNLDSKTSADVMDLLKKMNKDHGTTIILVTHDKDIARNAPRRIELKDGCIVKDD